MNIKKLKTEFINFIIDVICIGIEIGLIAKVVEILIITKTSFTIKGLGCLLLDCMVIGITAYGLTKDIKNVWEDD